MQVFNFDENYGNQLGKRVYECEKCNKRMPNDEEFIAEHNAICKPKKKQQKKK